jgi:hypothetical protein
MKVLPADAVVIALVPMVGALVPTRWNEIEWAPRPGEPGV